MNQRLITEIGKSQRLRIVNRLKRTQGLSVGELAEALGMSYMGVKQHCVELERRGYLDTWRRPKAPKQTGRPEMAYRLTRKAHELFPVTSNEATLQLLEAAQALFGPAAPEKLLFRIFQKKTERYLSKVKGANAEERAKTFSKLRDAEGYMAELEEDAAGWRIVEYHSPLSDLLAVHPALLHRLEEEMFSRVLGADVTREPSEASGLYTCVFRVEQPRKRLAEAGPKIAIREAQTPEVPRVGIPEPLEIAVPLEPPQSPEKPELAEPAEIPEPAEKSGPPEDSESQGKPELLEISETPEASPSLNAPEISEKAKPKPPKKRAASADQGEFFLFPME